MITKDFITWFDKTYADRADEEAATLKEFVQKHRVDLKAANDIAAARAVAGKYANDHNKTTLLESFDRAVADYDRHAAAQAGSESNSDDVNQTVRRESKSVASPPASPWPSRLATAGLVAVFAVFLIIIAKAVFDDRLMASLADISVARGLITFFFTIGTIGIAVAMVAALFLSNYPEGALKQRFDSGKEVLTTLIAILATVVGFYFGSDTSERAAAEGIALQPISVSNPQPRPEETVQITTLASGGEAPYRYTIDFQWDAADSALEQVLPDITNKESSSGLIAEKVVISKALAGKSIPYALTVTDARNRAYHANGEKLIVAAAQGPDRAAAPTPAPSANQ
jgi:hypothetical protein